MSDAKTEVILDGSQGEGGGQILRSGITLALVTGRPLFIRKIRAGRENPGLRPQHLACVRAAVRISGGTARGDEVGSPEVQFIPGPLKRGNYQFDIGTAGAATLLTQTLALPLALAASGPCDVLITGGTHVPGAPPYHWLERQWLPWMKRIGFEIDLRFEAAGFYPKGGGRMGFATKLAQPREGIVLGERGKLRRLSGVSMICQLPLTVADRQRFGPRRELEEMAEKAKVECKLDNLPVAGPTPGTMLLLTAEYEAGTGCVAALGEKGKRAEKVGEEALAALKAFDTAKANFDPHLADQLVLPLALAGKKSAFTTSVVTEHLKTQVEVVKKFLDVEIRIEGKVGARGSVLIDVPEKGAKAEKERTFFGG